MVRPYFFIGSLALIVGFLACKATGSNTNLTEDDDAASTGTSNNGGSGTASGLTVGSGGGNFSGGGGACGVQCSADLHTVIDCNGTVVEQCMGDQGCDISTVTCVNACEAAVNNKQSVVCEYFATDMDSMMTIHMTLTIQHKYTHVQAIQEICATNKNLSFTTPGRCCNFARLLRLASSWLVVFSPP